MISSLAPRALTCTALSFGLLVACGASSKPASQSGSGSTSSATAAGVSWDDLCKLAQVRGKRCDQQEDMLAKCATFQGCLDNPFDKGASVMLATCLASPDCDACYKAAAASPTPAGKAYLARSAEFAKTCNTWAQMGGTLGGMAGVYSENALQGVMDCIKPGADCNGSMNCAMGAGMDNFNAQMCVQDIGLSGSLPPPGSMSEPPPDTTGTESIGGMDELPLAGSMLNHPAPEIDVKPIGKGKAVTLKSLKGKFVYMHFWRTSCAPCGKSMATLEQFAKDNAKKKVVVIGIAIDTDDKGFADWVKNNPTKVPLMWDSQQKTAKEYHLLTMPETVVIDRKGNVAAEFTSAVVDPQDYAAVLNAK